jgi:hypothetical protein
MLSPYKDCSSLLRWQANLFVPLCNYGFVLAKVCGDFWSVDLILLFMKIIFNICGFNRTIQAMYAVFIVYEILVVCE